MPNLIRNLALIFFRFIIFIKYTKMFELRLKVTFINHAVIPFYQPY